LGAKVDKRIAEEKEGFDVMERRMRRKKEVADKRVLRKFHTGGRISTIESAELPAMRSAEKDENL
jgi:hypothetical protein